MPLKDGAYIRKTRLQKISREIAGRIGRSKQVSFKGLITWIQTDIGLSRNKAEEYVKLVMSSHNWENKGGFIVISSQEES